MTLNLVTKIGLCVLANKYHMQYYKGGFRDRKVSMFLSLKCHYFSIHRWIFSFPRQKFRKSSTLPEKSNPRMPSSINKCQKLQRCKINEFGNFRVTKNGND